MGFVIVLGVVALVVVVMLVYRRYGETRARPAGHWRRTPRRSSGIPPPAA
jgi:hypothetical protein